MRPIVFVILFGFCLMSEASEERSKALGSRINLFEAWITTQLNDQDLRGISVCFVHDQEIIYAKGFGHADSENRIVATENTNFRIASITKLFTSIAIMQLVERKVLHLETSVAQIIPELSEIKANGHDLDEITVRALLTHTSGLPTNTKTLLDKHAEIGGIGPHHFLDSLGEQSLIFPANRIHKYSNQAMNLAGLIIERVSGIKYEAYIRRYVIEPLKLSATGFPGDFDDSKVVGYSRAVGGTRVKNEFPEMASILGLPSSGLLSNVSDLGKFMSWHFRTLEGRDETILPASALSKMQTVQWVPLPVPLHSTFASVLAYFSELMEIGGTGLGYFLDGEFVMHGGGLMGFASELVMDRHKMVGVAVLSNTVDAPVRFSQPRSISKNLYDMLVEVVIDGNNTNASDNLSEYEALYSDNQHWHYYVIELDQKLAILDLLEEFPLEKPIFLSEVGEDRFSDPSHRGFYSGEFDIVFVRNQNGKIDSMRVNTNVLHRTE